MSEHKAKEKSRSGKIVGLLGQLLLLGGIAYMMVPQVIDHYYPKNKEGERMVEENMDNIVVDHSAQVDGDTFAQPQRYQTGGRIDLSKVDQVGDEAATAVAEMANIRDAKVAKAQRRIPVLRDSFVPAGVKGWVGADPVYEPMHFVSPKPGMSAGGEQICFIDINRTKTCWPVTGNPNRKLRSGERTVAQVTADPNHKRPLQPSPGNHGELRGQLCKNGDCSETFATTAEVFICGNHRGGDLQLMTNGIIEKGDAADYTDYEGQVGRFSYELIPDAAAKAACDAHPGALVVYPGQP